MPSDILTTAHSSHFYPCKVWCHAWLRIHGYLLGLGLYMIVCPSIISTIPEESDMLIFWVQVRLWTNVLGFEQVLPPTLLKAAKISTIILTLTALLLITGNCVGSVGYLSRLMKWCVRQAVGRLSSTHEITYTSILSSSTPS